MALLLLLLLVQLTSAQVTTCLSKTTTNGVAGGVEFDNLSEIQELEKIGTVVRLMNIALCTSSTT